jgi:cyclic pyranopterin phosphate synthase
MQAYPIVDGKVRTRALEYHVTDHCNLRCDHCCSFSPILKKWFADPGQVERDLRAVSRVVAPEFLKIVGGEPLLHPELETLLAIAKSVEAGERVQLTTNGLLLDRLTERGWQSINMLAISLYPEPELPRAQIRAIAHEAASRGITVNWKVQDRFTCLDRSEVAEYEETKRVFEECWIRHRCNSIKQGRFYCCTRPQYVQKFAGDAELFLEDGVVVDDPDVETLASRIKQHLERAEPLYSCFLCQGGNAPLETNRQLTTIAVRSKRERMTALAEEIAAAARS